MSSYITDAGLAIPTLVDLRQGLEASYQAVWGVDVDLSPEGYLGQHIGLMSKRDRDLWEMIQEILSSRDPDTATGVSLDEVCAETGVTRLAPTRATALVMHWMEMTEAVDIPVGSKVKASGSPVTYSIDSAISGRSSVLGPFLAMRLKVDPAFASGDTMSLVLGGYTRSMVYNSGTHGSVANFITSYFAPYVAYPFPESSTGLVVLGGANYLEIVLTEPETLTSTSGLLTTTESLQGWYGGYSCDTYGARSVSAGTLDTIATPIAGWVSITQATAGLDGTDTETDTALRLRRLRQMRSGTATEDAIRNAILRVDGVSFADVTSNRGNETDAEGVEAHWLEAVVAGGSDSAIASAIWTTAPAGIGFHGNFATDPTDLRPLVTGADGKQHRVNFSRPEPIFAWVEVTVVSPNLEESAPANILEAIQAAIVSWGQVNMGLGDDMILQKFYGPIFTVEGVGEVSIRHALTATAGGTPSYSTTAKLPIDSRHYASFDASRVVVS